MSIDKVVWIDRGWQSTFIGFCPSERAWKRQMKKMGLKGEPYPSGSAGRCTTFEKDGKAVVIISIEDGVEKDHSPVQVAALIVHECAHVWQAVRRGMNEDQPSIEFEAYAMQAIFQGVYQAWMDTRGAAAS